MGNKNSGRRPLSQEMKRHMVIDKAWEVTRQALDGEIALANKDKTQLAGSLAMKSMVDKQDISMKAHISQEEESILAKYIQGNRIGSNT